jgi:uncharacterized OB-fold protein
MTYAKPLPVLDPISKPFWALAAQGRFGLQVCTKCKDAHYPGTPVCPNCLSSDQRWEAVSGRGQLLSWATFHRAYWKGFEPDLPFTVGLIRLDEGPLFVCTLVEFEADKLRLDLPVEAVFEKVTDEITLPRFRPSLG